MAFSLENDKKVSKEALTRERLDFIKMNHQKE